MIHISSVRVCILNDYAVWICRPGWPCRQRPGTTAETPRWPEVPVSDESHCDGSKRPWIAAFAGNCAVAVVPAPTNRHAGPASAHIALHSPVPTRRNTTARQCPAVPANRTDWAMAAGQARKTTLGDTPRTKYPQTSDCGHGQTLPPLPWMDTLRWEIV